MSLDAAQARLKDQLYQSALQHFQLGEWDAGLADVARLVERFPLDHSLRAFSQEVQLRAKVDRDEQEDRRRRLRQRLVRGTTRLLAVVLVAGLAYWGANTYSAWAREQADVLIENLEQQRQVLDLAAKFTNAQALLRSGRPEEARVLLEEILVLQPDFPGAAASLAQAEAAASLEQQYAEAMGLIGQQDWNAALAVLQELLVRAPNYKDVAQQIAEAEKQYLLQDLTKAAEEYFTAQDWTAAVSAYESVRALDPDFQEELVEERLFNAYVNSARAALVDKTDSLEALETAEGYFRKALALRPQDPDIKTERELAGLYLKAQADYLRGQWTDAITALEIVLVQTPDYANGTARQTLYEAYVARGDAASASSEYEAALGDFQKAVELIESDRQATLALLEATLRLGEVQQALDNFEAAALHYRAVAELGGLREQALENPDLALSLEQADADLAEGKFGLAVDGYRAALRIADESREPASVVHLVQPGEYLTLIAGRYGSTVRAIVEANPIIENANLILSGWELVIPVLP